MPCRLIVVVQYTATHRSFGEKDGDEPYPHATTDLEAGFERGHERPRCQSPDLDRTGRAEEPVPLRRAVGVRVPGIAAVLDSEQIGKALPRAPVVQRECPGGLDRDLDPMVDERASFHERAFAGRSST